MLYFLLDSSEWTFRTYKRNLFTWLIMYVLIFRCFYLIYLFFFFFFIKHFNYCFSYCIHLYNWPTQQIILPQHMCWFLKASNPPMFSPIIISTSSYKGRWFRFLFHIWSAIPDFLISPRSTAFRYSSSLIFSGRSVSPLYILQLLGMK